MLAATVLGSAMAMLDATVVGIAQPTIGREFHADIAGLQWVSISYLLTLSGLLLLAGALGDRFGRRRVFLIGVAWFVLPCSSERSASRTSVNLRRSASVIRPTPAPCRRSQAAAAVLFASSSSPSGSSALFTNSWTSSSRPGAQGRGVAIVATIVTRICHLQTGLTGDEAGSTISPVIRL